MKGVCHIWSRGRLISPSMLVGDDWYLNLNSQKRPPGRNLGEHRLVRSSGYAANNIDNIIVDVNRHCEGALNYANDNLACLPHVGYPTRADQDLYKLDTRNITVN